MANFWPSCLDGVITLSKRVLDAGNMTTQQQTTCYVVSFIYFLPRLHQTQTDRQTNRQTGSLAGQDAAFSSGNMSVCVCRDQHWVCVSVCVGARGVGRWGWTFLCVWMHHLSAGWQVCGQVWGQTGVGTDRCVDRQVCGQVCWQTGVLTNRLLGLLPLCSWLLAETNNATTPNINLSNLFSRNLPTHG